MVSVSKVASWLADERNEGREILRCDRTDQGQQGGEGDGVGWVGLSQEEDVEFGVMWTDVETVSRMW